MNRLNLITTKVSHLAFKNYTYAIADHSTNSAILIDPAWQYEKIILNLVDYNVTPTAILLTHHHHDHVNLADKIAKSYDCPVYISKQEIEYYGFACSNIIPIDECDAFWINGVCIEPIFTPGHTIGGICYLINNWLFTGDTLFIEGCGACLDKGSNPSELFQTLQKLKSILSHDTLIYPGHSFGKEPGLSFQELLKYNIYCHIKSEKDFIEFRMRSQQNKTFSFK